MRNNQWRSQRGFLWACIGVSMGLEILWTFPGELSRGGYRFLIVFIIASILGGFTATTAGIIIGRYSGHSIVGGLVQINKNTIPSSVLAIIGALLAGSGVLSITSFAIRYFYGFAESLVGQFGFGGIAIGEIIYQSIAENVQLLVRLAAIAAIVCTIAVAFGIRKGFEWVVRMAVPAILGMLILVIIYDSIILKKADAQQIQSALASLFAGNDKTYTIGNAISSAAVQVGFGSTLAIGAVSMFAADTDVNEPIARDIWIITLGPVMMSVLAACAMTLTIQSSDITVGQSGKFIFLNMHDVFTAMGTAGDLIGTLFYMALMFSGLVLISGMIIFVGNAFHEMCQIMDWKTYRFIWVIIAGGLMLALSFPVLMGEGKLESSILTIYRFVSYGVIAPYIAIVTCIGCGWGLSKEAMREKMESEKKKWYMAPVARFMIRYIGPVFYLTIMIFFVIAFIKR